MTVCADCEYIRIVRQPVRPGRKLFHFTVENKRTGGVIGEIKWYGRWRQYCLFPDPSTVWSSGCLEDVFAFMRTLRNGSGRPLPARS